jgi:hypothetical protein
VATKPASANVSDQVAREDINSKDPHDFEMGFAFLEFFREEAMEFLVLEPLPDVGSEWDAVRHSSFEDG